MSAVTSWRSTLRVLATVWAPNRNTAVIGRPVGGVNSVDPATRALLRTIPEPALFAFAVMLVRIGFWRRAWLTAPTITLPTHATIRY